MIGAIDPAERLVTIEDTLELVIPQPNHVRLLYSKDDIGLSHVTAEALLQAVLRMRPTGCWCRNCATRRPALTSMRW